MSDYEEEERKPKKQIGLRKDNLPTSSVNNDVGREKVRQADAFEKSVRTTSDNLEYYKNEMFSLATQFKGLIDDRTFNDNKGPIVLSLEKETLARLAALAAKMNEDDAQPESSGSNTLCVLLMKCMLSQRDSINKLDHKVAQLESKIAKAEAPKND